MSAIPPGTPPPPPPSPPPPPPPPPVPTLSAGVSAATAKTNQSVSFTETATNGTLVSCSWNFGDGSAAVTTQGPSHAYPDIGTFTATLSATVNDTAGTPFALTATCTVTVERAATSGQSAGGKWITIKTPDYDGGTDTSQLAYLRIGARSDDPLEGNQDQIIYGLASDPNASGKGRAPNGWYEYVKGARTEYVKGDREIVVDGRNRLKILNDGDPLLDVRTRAVGGFGGSKKLKRTTTKRHSATDSYTFGDTESFSFGFSFSAKAGFDAGIAVSGELKVSATAAVSFTAASSTAFSMGTSYTKSKTITLNESKSHSLQAYDNIHFAVQTRAAESKTTKVIAGSVAALVGALGAASASWVSGYDDSKSDDMAATWATRIGYMGAMGIWSAALMYANLRKLSFAKTEPLTEINLDKDMIHLRAGNSSIHIGKDMINLEAKEIVITQPPAGTMGPAFMSAVIDKGGLVMHQGDIDIKAGGITTSDDAKFGGKITVGGEVDAKGIIKTNGHQLQPLAPAPPKVPPKPPKGKPSKKLTLHQRRMTAYLKACGK